MTTVSPDPSFWGPTAPLPQPPVKAKTPFWAIILVLIVIAGVISGVSSLLSSGSSSSSPSVSQSVTASGRAAFVDWTVTSGFKDALSSYSSDLTTVAGCQVLATDVTSMRATLPSPDVIFNRAMDLALLNQQISDNACMSGDMSTAASYQNDTTTLLKVATDRVNVIYAGN